MSRINWMKELGWTDEHVEDLRFAGYSYIRQGKYDIALPFFEALAALKTDSAYDAQTLGAIYLQIGKPKDAIKCFDKALKSESDHTPTLLNLTKALLMLGKKEEALKLAELLSKESNPQISNMAKALLLAFG